MKVALCLHGHLRTFDKCLPKLKESLIDLYQPDVFAMTWMDSMGSFLPPTESANPRFHPGYNLNDPPVSLDNINELIKQLNPVDTHLDHFFLQLDRFNKIIKDGEPWQYPNLCHRPLGTLGLFYARYVNLKMKQRQEQIQGWKYDYVIATRWDILHKSKIEIEKLNLDRITMPQIKEGPNTIMGDVWVGGPSDPMDAWSRCFEYIPILPKLGIPTLDPHILVEIILNKNKINFEYNTYLGSMIQFQRP